MNTVKLMDTLSKNPTAFKIGKMTKVELEDTLSKIEKNTEIQQALEPLLKEIEQLKIEMEIIKKALTNPILKTEFVHQFSCDGCGSRPFSLYKTDKGTFCSACYGKS